MIRLKSIWLTLIFLCLSTTIYAGELDGLGNLFRNLFLIVIGFILISIFLLWFFRDNLTFVIFTFLNLMLFVCIILIMFTATSVGTNLDGLYLFVFFLPIQIIVQICFTIKAIYDK